jgi:acetyl-CoA carboxylase biotin carboxylase subunit
MAHFPVDSDLRVDTHMEAGATIPPFYDSMIAKVIATGRDREHARRLLETALADVRIEGVHTNIELHRAVLATNEFMEGGFDTGFLGRFLAGSGAAIFGQPVTQSGTSNATEGQRP